jgi:hypothetical protein
MLQIPRLKLAMYASTMLMALAAPALAQSAKPADVPVAAVDDFSTPKPGQTAGSLMADVSEKLNAIVRDKKQDDEIYATGLVELKIADPVELAKMRDSLAQRAWLEAQTKLITSIYSTFEASTVFEIPGNPIENKFKDQRTALEKQINVVQDNLKSASFAFDQAHGLEVESKVSEADEVKLVDRAGALIDGVIKRLDSDFSPEKLAQQKEAASKKKFEAMMRVTAESKAQLEGMQKQLDALNDQMKEEMSKVTTSLTSDVQRAASMPLIGATVIDMAESYINGTYQIALVMKWSRKNEKFALGILKGEAVKDDPVPGRSVTDWLGRIDKGTMLGSRVFTDENGDRWFIGVGSYPTQGGGARLTVAQTQASLAADRSLMFALLANAKSYEEAKSRLDTSTSDTTGEASSYSASMAKKLSADLPKTAVPNKRLLVDRQAVNTVTGQDVWVDIVAVNATGSKKALDDLKRTFASAIDVSRYQGDLQGRAQGMNDAQKDVAVQAKAIQAGAAAQMRQDLVAAPKVAVAPNPAAKTGGIMEGSTIPGHKAGGVATGGGYSDD